jgi:hypothetical protein
MGRRINEALHESWRERLEQQVMSGLTVAAFCRQTAIRPQSFYAWRRRLKGRGVAWAGAARGSRCDQALLPLRGDTARAGGGTFLRVPLEIEAHTPCLEVVLGDQTRLRVPGQHLVAWELTLQAVIHRLDRHEPREARHA